MSTENISEAEFDQYVEQYEAMHKESTKHAGFELSYYDEYKIKELARIFPEWVDKEIQILNFGCGIGKSEPYFVKYFPKAKITGIDVSKKSVEYAKERNPTIRNNVRFIDFDGVNLPTDTQYDLIFTANVFHHIPHDIHAAILKNIQGILKENGTMCMFEHNPQNPLTMKAVKDCAFDINAHLLTPSYAKKLYQGAAFKDIKINYTLFFPSFLSVFIPLEKMLTWLPIGAQYYLLARK